MSFPDRWVGFLGSLVSLAVALQKVIEVDFLVKLAAVGISAVFAVWACSSWLIRTKGRTHQIGFTTPKPPSSVVHGTLVLGVLCALFSLGAYLIIKFYAINVTTIVDEHSDRVEIWFRGAYQQVDLLVIEVPRQGNTKCKPLPNPDLQHVARTVAYDWSSANPQLHIADFRYPQQQGLECAPRSSVSELVLRTKPASVEVFFPERRLDYGLTILFIGGVLWLVSALFVSSRMR